MRPSVSTAAVILLLGFAPSARARQVPRPQDLSVEELTGQVFMIAVDTEIASAREADVRSGRLGGGILRWERFTGDEARALSLALRAWSVSAPRPIPFWLSTDHEGGPLFTQRRYGAAPFPGNMALGAADSQALAYDAAEATARELRSFGISITFAPVLDVNSNPANPIIGLRSFGSDPEAAARLGRAALRGYRAGGLLAAPKHFPGHGDTSDDSHLGLPVSAKTLGELEATELLPFRAAIAAGAEAVMPAHMVFPALGAAPDQPVTLSSAVIEGFLRGKMGFRGLVISDSLDMGAIANRYGSPEAAVLSLLAGNDVLLLGKGDYPAAFAAVVGAVKSGRVPRARLEASVARILEAKRRLGLFDENSEPRALSPEILARDQALARRVAESAVTLARNDGTVPLKLQDDDELGLVLIHAPRYADEAARFAAEIARRHARTTFVDVSTTSPSAAAVSDALARTAGASAVIVGTSQFGAPMSEGQRLLVRGLTSRPAPVVAVSLMNPYDLPVLRGARAAVCVYGMTDSALDAAARLIFGEIPPLGRLPVTVPDY